MGSGNASEHRPFAPAGTGQRSEAEALSAALGESASGLPATRDDVTGIKLDRAEIKSEQKLMKWMFGLPLAGVVSLILKAFF